MHVTRPPAVPSQLGKQLAHGAITRNWIRHRHNRIEPEDAFLVTADNRSTIRCVSAVVVLYIVFAVAVCFPYIYLDVAERLARGRLDSAQYEERVTVRVARYGTSGSECGSVVGVKGAEDCAFSAGGELGVVN